jgi:site-specific recombinase XerD
MTDRAPHASQRSWQVRSGVGNAGPSAEREAPDAPPVGGQLLGQAAPAAPADWPGVADPDVLRRQIGDWLSGYANAGTRRTYAYALGLPVAWVDPRPSDRLPPAVWRPPAAAPGPLHHLAWFRWCAHHELDPRAATGRDVKAWLHALDAAGAQPRTRQRMLSTVSALYAHLVETEVVAANPATVNRRRLGLTTSSRDASPTIRLTAAQVTALVEAAGRLRTTELYRRRAVAVLALLTLGLRISELTGLARGDRRRSGGEDVLRVLGKGKVYREVFLTDLARDALDAYLAERDRANGTAVPAPLGRTRAGSTPLIATRDGRPCSRTDLWALLRRVARAAGPELDEMGVHPHALRHAYVTIALEEGAPIQHVQADVGHASIATTQHYDRGLRTRATTAADQVGRALTRPAYRPSI